MSPHPPRTSIAFAVAALCLVVQCFRSNAAPATAAKPKHPPVVGKIERLDPALDKLVAPDAKIENLGEGFNWVEGPVWVREGMVRDGGGYFLCSEVKANRVLKWAPGQGISQFLKPSGYTNQDPRGGEPGSNGLTVDPEGRLVLCQHGDRRVARLEKDGSFTSLADRYEGKRFNSPNDLCFDRRRNLYFTDPPYGLEKNMDDPKKELDFQGVFRVAADGKLTLVTKEMSRPNGIALSPDERTLYVANSDTAKPVVMAFELKPDGSAGPGRVFFDALDLARQGRKGLPDGLKVDRQGNVFLGGPGGVLVITPEGKHLGTIAPGEITSNCAFGGADGDYLYMTCDMMVCRVRLATRGDPPPPPSAQAQAEK